MSALPSGQFVAFGSENNNAEDTQLGKQLITAQTKRAVEERATPQMPSEGILQEDFFPEFAIEMKLAITHHVLEKTSPLRLALVCKAWHRYVLDADFVKLPKKNTRSISFSERSNFAQACMKIWWGNVDQNRFNSGVLFCNPPEPIIDIELEFAVLDNTNGVFALPAALTTDVRIMKNVDEFLRTGGENAEKTIVLVVLHREAEKAARSMDPNHPFVSIVKNWDISKAGVGIFIRNGSDDIKVGGFFHHTNASFASLSEMGRLFDILQKSAVMYGTGRSSVTLSRGVNGEVRILEVFRNIRPFYCFRD